jgi:hypothetical protein
MLPNEQQARILAIDLRPQRFGYAIFEGPIRLLDWGVAEYRPGGTTGAAAAQKSIAKLLGIFSPSLVVVKIERRKSMPNSPGVKPILAATRRVATAHGALFRTVTRRDLRNAFRVHGAKTKYEIASTLAVMFPELLWKLPPPRKIYKSEASSMTIFDAVAMGVTHWQMLEDINSAQ